MDAFGIFEGGGAKGYAHIGALRASEERGIKFCAVAGTSIGAIFAALIAAGYTSAELFGPRTNPEVGLLSRFDPMSLLDPKEWGAVRTLSDQYKRYSKRGAPGKRYKFTGNALFMLGVVAIAYFNHRRLFKRIRHLYGAASVQPIHAWLDEALRAKLQLPQGQKICFRDMKTMPLKVISADLSNGKMRVFGGPDDADLSVVDAVLASASIPFVFQPRTIADNLHVDGGMLSNHPAWVFDRERARLTTGVPTFGFKLVDLPLDVPTLDPAITSLAGFCRALVRTAIFGASELESRQIDDYYAIDLTTDVDVLAFDEAADRSFDLVEQGRISTQKFFTREIGPRDPDEMRIGLSVIASEIKRILNLTVRPRVFVVLPLDDDFCRVSYSIGMEEGADDRLRLRRDSIGPGQCFGQREPIITRVARIPTEIRTNPILKLEHGCRPADVKTVYSCPVFRDPAEWSKAEPAARQVPIAVLVFDSIDDLALKLQDPLIEDRLATLVQLIGEQLRGNPLTIAATPPSSLDLAGPAWLDLDSSHAFAVATRKSRFLVMDDDMRRVAERIDDRIVAQRSR